MEDQNYWEKQRDQIIGLGENSFKKSYYPELQQKISELEASYSNLNAIFNTINDGVVIHDEKGKILLLNARTEKIFNITDQEKDNYTIFDFSQKNLSNKELISIWDDVLKGNSRIIDWTVQQNITGIEIPVQISMNSTTWYGQKVLVSAIRDITDRKQFERELILAKEKAEESNRLKTAFLQNLSHEIRTPMNAICGFSSLLSSPDLPVDKRNSFITIIQDSSNQLLSIVNDILTISALETKQEKVNIQNTCINTIIDNLFQSFNSRASKQNIAFACTKRLTDDKSIIKTDGVKLTRILTNLVDNAIKFTPKGSVEFGYQIISSNNNPYVQFYVTDTGVGINKENHETIFERFWQAETSISRQYGGTGLGLPISKAFVELLDGKIWIESEPGKGSTFFFTIPYKQEDKQHHNETPIKNKKSSTTIIIAEDEEYNFRFIKELLNRFDFEIIHTRNGLETVNICKSNSNIKFILMDIKMPLMDGHTAAKLIKELYPELPIIAQSAYALDIEINKYKNAFDSYITKPINSELLFDIINKYR